MRRQNYCVNKRNKMSIDGLRKKLTLSVVTVKARVKLNYAKLRVAW